MKSGIYKITNLANDKIYIGSALDYEERWRLHIVNLNGQKHHSRHLQSAYNKYGKDNFRFEVIEFCEKEKLLEREQYWMDATKCYDDKFGYNINIKAESRLGVKSKPFSKEHRKKLSEAGKRRIYTPEFGAKVTARQLGQKLSEEHKLNISLSRLGNKFHRKKDKWPCPDGCHCKCNLCMEKKRTRNNNYYHFSTKKNVKVTYIGIIE